MDQISNIMPNESFDVRVKRVFKSGVLVECPDKSEGWLPADEWSYARREWEPETIRKESKIKVVYWGKSFKDGQHALSRRRADGNPWNKVTKKEWIGQVKLFEVTRLTKRCAIGEIEPGLQASLDLATFDKYIEELDRKDIWKSHCWIALGDWVGGVVSEIHFPGNSDDPCIVVDPYQLFKKIEHDPTYLAKQENLVSPPERKTVSPSSDIYDRAPNVHHIFLLDNDENFLKAVSAVLRGSGYKVTETATEEEAIKKLKDQKKTSIDIALIDLHLRNDEAVHDGMKVAKYIAKTRPYCKIVLISGEDIDHGGRSTSKLSDGKGLKVASYLQKPLTIAQLHNEITRAATLESQDMAKVLEPFFNKSNSEPPRSYVDEQKGKKQNRQMRCSIQESVDWLGRKLSDVVVHVFEMHPLKKQGRSIAYFGEGLVWEPIKHKLAKSPVRDTAIDPSRKFWVEDDVDVTEHFQKKHLWLRQAMYYRSALGVPISTASQMGHCLLAFHPEPGKFSPEFCVQSKLCAERIARALEWEWLMKESEERFLLQTAGMAFVSLSHELRGVLSGLSAEAFRLKEEIETIIKGGSRQPKVVERADRLYLGIDRAIAISQTFRGTQSRNTPESIDVLGCLDEAIQATKHEIPKELKIDITRTEDGAGKNKVKGDRSSLVIALFNLLLNAVQQITIFGRKKGLVWVECSTVIGDGADEWIRIDVNDTGPGIHSSDFERVFDPGYSTKPDKQGMGMGLHICRKVITNISEGEREGKVEISESVLCMRTTFSIYLPILKTS